MYDNTPIDVFGTYSNGPPDIWLTMKIETNDSSESKICFDLFYVTDYCVTVENGLSTSKFVLEEMLKVLIWLWGQSPIVDCAQNGYF